MLDPNALGCYKLLERMTASWKCLCYGLYVLLSQWGYQPATYDQRLWGVRVPVSLKSFEVGILVWQQAMVPKPGLSQRLHDLGGNSVKAEHLNRRMASVGGRVKTVCP